MKKKDDAVPAPQVEMRFAFDLCPSCSFFAGSAEGKRHCIDCGAELIHECPRCAAAIENPYAHFCAHCGGAYREAGKKQAG